MVWLDFQAPQVVHLRSGHNTHDQRGEVYCGEGTRRGYRARGALVCPSLPAYSTPSSVPVETASSTVV